MRNGQLSEAAKAGRSDCRWFLLCDHPATSTMAHPTLGPVPICDRCRTKVERLTGS